jgi:predicted amidophosphoribosyltransferase
MNKRLTLEEKLEHACFHAAGSKHPLWVTCQETGHVVCSHCGKPAPDIVFRICWECGDEFVLELDQNWVSKYFVTSDGKVFERETYCPPCY